MVCIKCPESYHKSRNSVSAAQIYLDKLCPVYFVTNVISWFILEVPMSWSFGDNLHHIGKSSFHVQSLMIFLVVRLLHKYFKPGQQP